MLPENLLYTKEHEWILIEGEIATIGITDYAQEELGDITFVELPSIGDNVESGDSPVTLESVKAVSSVYSPFSGEVIEVNENIEEKPEIINSSPFTDGWIYKMKITDKNNDKLLDAASYKEFIDNLN